MLHTRRPAAAFYPRTELGGDPRNWWGPNPEAVRAMLLEVGFSRAEVVTPDSTRYRLGRMGKRAGDLALGRDRQGERRSWRISQGRAVFHAERA